MPEQEIKISVVIVNYKSQRFLPSCLSSVFANFSQGQSVEVIVVNNDRDEDLAEIKKLFPQIKVLNNTENRGFGYGCNLGAKMAQGKYLFFLNPDTEILSGKAQEVVSILENDKKIGIIGSRLVTPEGKIQKWSAGTKVNILNLILDNLGLSRSQRIWKSSGAKESFWVAGASLFIGKNLFYDLGGFDEKIFMYFEDVDLCCRAKKKGLKIMYYPFLRVLHKNGESYLNDKKKQQEHYCQSQQYYFEKHCGKNQSILIRYLRKIFA